MKRNVIYALLAAGFTSLSAEAALKEIAVSSTSPKVGEEVTVTISDDAGGSARCGLLINFGDGETREVKVDPKEKPFPLVLTKTYNNQGSYTVNVDGKTFFRGFNTFGACDGKLGVAVNVTKNAATQVAVAETSRAMASNNESLQRALAVTNSGKRVALVIGNGKYKNKDILPALPNPTNDAEDISKALRSFGFDVMEFKDLSLEGMNKAVADFGRKIANADAAMFYFAGHGLQVKGQNYLLPVDAKIESDAQVPYQSVNMNQVLEEMDNAKSAANIVMLDACRNNPMTGKFRSGATRGLAPPASQPKGTIIVYATDPGNVALDGTGRNGLFTSGLLNAFKGDDLSLRGVLSRASKEVEQGSGKSQTPYINGPLTLQEDFKFGTSAAKPTVVANLGNSLAPSSSFAPAAPAKTSKEIEQDIWNNAREGSMDDVNQYIRQYPSGRFIKEAKARLATLQAELKKHEEEQQRLAKQQQAQQAPVAPQSAAVQPSGENGAVPQKEVLAVFPPRGMVGNSGQIFYGLLTNALAKSRRFTLIEKGDTNVNDDASAANIAKQLNAKYAVSTSVAGQVVPVQEPKFEGVPFTNSWRQNGFQTVQKSELVLDMRLVDVKTKAIVQTIQAKGSGSNANLVESQRAALASLEKHLQEELGNAFPLTGYIIKINSSKQFLIDLGSTAGVREGDEFNLYIEEPDIIHPGTGRVIKGARKTIGTGKIENVQAELSVLNAAELSTPVILGQTKLESKPKAKACFLGVCL